MKTKHVITILMVLISGWGIVSCDDDNERFFLYQIDEVVFPDQAISSTAISIVGGGSVGITGGKAPYTAEIEDEQIATVKVDEDRVRISPVKLGTTSLIVKDADGLTVKIGVKVVESVQRFMSNAVYVKIEDENVNEANKETLEELEAQVIADGFLKATGYVRFVYNTKDGGEMTLLAENTAGAKIITAPFEKVIKQIGEESYSAFLVNYEDRTHEFYLTAPERPEPDTRSLGPMPCWLVEDVTEIYKAQYSELGLTSVRRVCIGSLSR